MAKTHNEIDTKVINLISKGTKITGDIASDGDIRIDGELKGTIQCKGRLVVGDSGFIQGEIKCSSSEISGEIKGKLTVSELLSLKASSKVIGDMCTGKLAIEPGAVFSGSCQMGGDTKSNENKPAEKA
ncbi:MAG: polymer-forming cytoskeletal protein [Prolixibacteraceae bacterium]|jgi:cytoskeletal protein CcmA (bactofilin family)|nr:polymer-forming cytoskeletal protein [Prolixibacteraceae bacterium]